MNSANRIRTLRLARGYSQDDLVAQMGGVVTKAALSKYELGKSRPSAPVALRLANALGVKAVELFSEPRYQVEFLAYRRRVSMKVSEQNHVENWVEVQLQDRMKLQERLEGSNGNSLGFRKYVVNSIEHVEEVAVKLRNDWAVGLDPIPNMTDLLESRRVHVLETEVSEKFDGLSAVVKNAKGVVIGAGVVCQAKLQGERQRMNLAHELGHLILDPVESLDIETVAKRFAGALLIPAEVMFKELGGRRNYLPLEEMLILKRRYGVSIQAIVMRAAILGIISQHIKTQWFKQNSRLGWRKSEPESLPAEEAQRWKQLVTRGLAEQIITPDEAGRYLSRNEIESIMSPSNSFNYQAYFALPMEERRRILNEQAKADGNLYSSDRAAIEWLSQLEDEGGIDE